MSLAHIHSCGVVLTLQRLMQEDDIANDLLPSFQAQTPAVTPAVTGPTLAQECPATDGVGTFIQDSLETPTPTATPTAAEGQVPAICLMVTSKCSCSLMFSAGRLCAVWYKLT